MTPEQRRARLHAIIDRMNAGYEIVDDSDGHMVGAASEMHDAVRHMQAGLDYVMKVAAENKRIITLMREANAEALALLNEPTEDPQ